MSPRELSNHLAIAMRTRRKVLIKGKPGVGKTQIVKQTAAANGYDLWIAHPALSEAVDYKGYPVSYLKPATTVAAERRVVEFLPDEFLDQLRTAERPTLAFFDDVGQSSQTVQAALMQLIQEGRLNGHLISPQVLFCGATNSLEHMAGVSGFIEPFKGRWDTIVELTVSMEEWLAWGRVNNMPDIVLAFIRTRTELLHAFVPTRTLERTPDPRAWEKVGRWLNDGVDNTEILAGCIGQGAASELSAFITLAKKCPDLDAILAKPDTIKIPDELNLRYLIVSGLARRATMKNMDKVAIFLARLDQSLRTLCYRDAAISDPNITSTKAYIGWARSEGRELIY